MFDPMKIFQQLWANPGAVEQMAQKAAMQGSPDQMMEGLQVARQNMPEIEQQLMGAAQGTAGPMSPVPGQGTVGPMSPVPIQPQMAYGQGAGQAQPQGVPNPAYGQPSPLGAALRGTPDFPGADVMGPVDTWRPPQSSGFAGPMGSPRAAGAEQIVEGEHDYNDAALRAAKAWELFQGQQQPAPAAPSGRGPALGAAQLAGAPVSSLFQQQAQPGIGAALAQALRGRRF
jgi:hypothetical protein